MAVIEHISIKNYNYDAAYDYLTTKHDEFTNKPILDENGLTPKQAQALGMGICSEELPWASDSCLHTSRRTQLSRP